MKALQWTQKHGVWDLKYGNRIVGYVSHTPKDVRPYTVFLFSTRDKRMLPSGHFNTVKTAKAAVESAVSRQRWYKR